MEIIRKFLLPFSILYKLITSFRNLLYDVGIFRSFSFSIPTIIVGNLSVGGTGKTPQIEYLIRLLCNNKKVAVLSRGYKRKTKGFILIRDYHPVEEVGDEPFQFFKKFKNIDVAVDADRVNGIKVLIDNVNPDLVLLDDAFQHRRIKGDFKILLSKYDDLFVDDKVLPVGNLRESISGSNRADVVIVTKCPEGLSSEEQNQITNKIQSKVNKPVFFTSISYAEKTKGYKNYTVEDFKNNEIFVVTGIANPKPLLEFLVNINYKIHHLQFPDHHYFTEEDITRIKTEFENLPNNKILLTTEKDFMRLEGKIKELTYLPIETKFLNNQEDFDLLVKSNCNTNS